MANGAGGASHGGRAGTLWLAHGRRLEWGAGRPRLMGILNVTPDSFSDGGKFVDAGRALEQARRMIAEGAELIDIGGESSRPGAAPVSLEEELRRILPVVEALASMPGVAPPLLSIDTTKAAVARQAIAAGAHLINDISAGTADPEMFAAVAELGAGICLMHMSGNPATMQLNPVYEDVVSEVAKCLGDRAEAAQRAGVAIDSIVIDPGIGFGKTMEHNVALLRGLRRIPVLAGQNRFPMLVGVSRKSFLGKLAGIEAAAARDGVTQIAHAACVAGGAAFLRVHDVAMARQALAVADALLTRCE